MWPSASSSSSVGPSRCSSTRWGKRPSATEPNPRTTTGWPRRSSSVGLAAQVVQRGRGPPRGRGAGPWPRAPRAGGRPRRASPRSGARRRSGAARSGPGRARRPRRTPRWVASAAWSCSHGGAYATVESISPSSSVSANFDPASGPIAWSDGFTTRKPSGAPTASTTVAATAANTRGSVRWSTGAGSSARARKAWASGWGMGNGRVDGAVGVAASPSPRALLHNPGLRDVNRS